MASEHELVRQIANALLLRERDSHDGLLTREMIAEQVDQALAMGGWVNPPTKEDLVRELETMHTQSIGVSRTLEDASDHIPWLPNARADITWRYWNRYKQYLQQKGWAPASLDSLDKLTDETLGRLESPNREGGWDRRGMVVGHVQSGKTANYTGLICKGVDAGYKLVIVLAGLTNSLRSQTQIRLDEGFLGFDSGQGNGGGSGPMRVCGVGEFDTSLRPDTITNRLENGDFKRSVANQFHINPGNSALLFVVKKNGSVLRNLVEWIRRKANAKDDAGRPVVRGVPLLVIDDEADHGSVNTRAIPTDDSGNPVDDYDPTVTNRRIRELLHCFQQSAYVGYTATPFANIFIHEDARHADCGEDLFPRSFITKLQAPSNYFGPREIFGIDDGDPNSVNSDGLPIVRAISDHAASLDLDERVGWVPPKHSRAHVPHLNGKSEIPASLREALLAFILARAVRLARGQTNHHNSMLIHVTRFVDVQTLVCAQVETEFRGIANSLHLGDGGATSSVRDELQQLWENDFAPTMREIGSPDCDAVTFDDVSPHLAKVAKSTEIMTFNGSARDALDYESYKQAGLNVIAIGGDKLARGLTLEGLSVSYFLRASKMYDTLMQMGRWFGYRPGYIDVCRLYTTPDMIDWFGHIAIASEELRREFDYMANVGGTPKDFGLKVRSHPLLLVTSQVKMRHGTHLEISFEGKTSEAVVYHRDPKKLAANTNATSAFIQRIYERGVKEVRSPERERPGGRRDIWEGSVLWEGVPAEEVRSFLLDFDSHSRSISTRLIAEFIERQNGRGALTDWTVAMLQGEGKPYDGFPFGSISLVKRSWDARRVPKDQQDASADFVIRRVGSPRDEAIDIGPEAYQRAFDAAWEARRHDDNIPEGKKKPTGPAQMREQLRQVRPRTQGLLLLYPMDPAVIGSGEHPIVGLAICFPSDPEALRVGYDVNNVYWRQEYASAD